MWFLFCCFVMSFLRISGAPINNSEEIVSPLKIAQCRSLCLQKFSLKPNKTSNCLQGPDCFMCWENCELLQANFQIWGSICDETDICFPGCQEACKFHRDSPQKKQVEPVIKARGEEVLRTSYGVARWPEPAVGVGNSPPYVYIVMRKNTDATWTQIVQTTDRQITLGHDTITANLRVLVVNPRGLVTMYSPLPEPAEELNDKIVSRIMAGINENKKPSEKITLNTPKSRKWLLKSESLIHQKILVLAEVSWEQRMSHAVYLVTWEVDGGGLKGNLFTDSTSVTLSLWPDTIYHIQVELMSKTTDKAQEKSDLLVLDTRKASQVNFDTKNKNFEEVKKDKIIGKVEDKRKTRPETTSKIEDSSDVLKYISNHPKARKIFQDTSSEINKNKTEEIDTVKTDLKTNSKLISPSILVKREDSFRESLDNTQELELVLGSVAAILLFITITMLLIYRCKHLFDDNNKHNVLGMSTSEKVVKIKPIILLTEPRGNDQFSLKTKDNFQNFHQTNVFTSDNTTISNDKFIEIIENSCTEVQV